MEIKIFKKNFGRSQHFNFIDFQAIYFSWNKHEINKIDDKDVLSH